MPPKPSAAVGRVLDGRYRLTAVLESGGAVRYRADDLVEGREVAVRLLPPDVADDPALLSRFRASARSVAGFERPHVVSLLDWGEDGAPYLVNELLPGGDLRRLVDAGYRLSLSQAAQVGAEAARGLEAAHRRGLVHPRLTPSAVVFDGDGRAGIADLGVAEVLARASGDVSVADVRYLSPEESAGAEPDAASDLYRLALALIEGVTGKVPLIAGSPQATMELRRVEPVPVPARLGVLGPVLERCGGVDGAERPAAGMLAAELESLVDQLPPPTAIPDPTTGSSGGRSRWFTFRSRPRSALLLAAPVVAERSPDAAAGAASGSSTLLLAPPPRPGVDVDATVSLPVEPITTVIPVPDHGGDEPDGGGPGGGPVPGPPAGGGGGRSGHAPEQGETTGEAAPAEAADRSPRDGWQAEVSWLVVALAFAVLVIAGALLLVQTRTASAVVPGLEGLTESAARTALARTLTTADDVSWQVRVDRRPDDEVPEGLVVEQLPPEGTSLVDGGEVVLAVSSGAELVPVPDVSGRAELVAIQALEGAGFAVGAATREDHEEVPRGSVIRWSAEGRAGATEARLGALVDLVVSNGPAARTVPELAGEAEDAARSQLEELLLVPEVAYERHPSMPVGAVIGTDPAAGALVDRHAVITVRVSAGPPPAPAPPPTDPAPEPSPEPPSASPGGGSEDDGSSVVVPDVTGQRGRSAVRELRRAGLEVGGVSGFFGRVVTTDPAPGSRVAPGTRVDLVIG